MKSFNDPAEPTEAHEPRTADRLRAELALCRAELNAARECEAAAKQRAVELARANEALRGTVDQLSGTGDLAAFLDYVLIEIARHAGTRTAGLFIYRPLEHTLYQHASVWDGVLHRGHHPQDPLLFRKPFPADITPAFRRSVAERSLFTTDLAGPSDQMWPGTYEVWKSLGFTAIGALALVAGDRPVGYLGLGWQDRADLTDAQRELVQALANQASLALELTRLTDEVREATVARAREAAAQERADQLARANLALASSTARLAAEPDLDTFLGAVLVEAAEQAGACGNALFLYDPVAHALDMSMFTTAGTMIDIATDTRMLVWRNPTPVDINTAWENLQSRKPLLHVIAKPDADLWPHLIAWHREMGHGSVVSVPLFAGDRALGFMGLCFREQTGSAPERVELAQALANQAALAIELTRLADATRKSAVGDERNRIARDIHDTLAQDFSAIVAHLQSVRRKLAASGFVEETVPAILAGLEAASEAAREGLMEARRSVWALTPHALECGEGCATALRAVVTRLAPSADFFERGNPRSLPLAMQVELLGVCREAVANAARHAGADAHIAVSIACEADHVEMVVEDDGNGFDPRIVEDTGGGRFGLWTMRERASRVGGWLNLNSRPGGGTRVSMTCPLTALETAREGPTK